MSVLRSIWRWVLPVAALMVATSVPVPAAALGPATTPGTPIAVARVPAALDSDLPPTLSDLDHDGDIDYQDAAIASTSLTLRPYLLVGIGIVLLGLALLAGLVLIGPSRLRRRSRPRRP